MSSSSSSSEDDDDDADDNAGSKTKTDGMKKESNKKKKKKATQAHVTSTGKRLSTSNLPTSQKHTARLDGPDMTTPTTAGK